ncbi:MAG: PAS domain S-box protein [Ktedonobacteraceae bacterium]
MSIEAQQPTPSTQSQVTEVFKQSEKLFRILIENSSDAIALLTAEAVFLYVSPPVQKMLGFTPEELVGRNGFELVPPAQLALTGEQFGQVLNTPDVTIVVEHQFLHKDGSIKWLESSLTNLLHDPAVQAIVSNFRDISERKQIEERQRLLNAASEMFLSSLDHDVTLKEIAGLLVPSLADYCRIAILDEKQQIKDITVNHIDPEKLAFVQELYDQYKDRASTTHGLQRLLQSGQAELISTVSQSVLDTVQDNPVMLNMIQILELKSYMGVPLIARERTIGAMTFSSVQPYRHYTQDDLLFTQELARRIALVLDNAHLYRAAQEEITERTLAEEKLRQSEELYRLVVEHTTDLITLLDIQGTILYISPSCESLLGYKADEMIGKMASAFEHPDDLPQIEREFSRMVQGEIATVLSYRAKHKDGHWVTFSATGSATYDEQGQPSLIVTTSHDVTQQIELERRKDEFISIASHELRTPVTSIKGFTQILQRRFQRLGDEDTLRYLSIMEKQLNKLTALINDLLDLSKIQAGKLTFQAERFDLVALVQEIVEMIQQTTQSHRLMLEHHGEVQIVGDRDRLGQVLINLLTNAVKYSPHADKVIIRICNDEAQAQVSVQDFGIGIQATEHEKIFERFYQAPAPLEHAYPGLGMGLYISNEIVTRHSGQIWVESRKGEGSTFYMIVPLAQEEQ